MRKYEIYIGCEFDKDSLPVKANPETLDQLAINYFGGFSRHYVEGGFRHSDGRIAREQSVCYVIFAEDPHFAGIFAADCKILNNQESVCIVNPDNSVQFI